VLSSDLLPKQPAAEGEKRGCQTTLPCPRHAINHASDARLCY